MKTQVSTIIRDVETALNEIDPNQASFVGDRDHSDLQTLIESKIEESVDRIHRQADISRMALDATIDIHYDDAARTVTLGTRKGQFPGMLKQRRFNIVLITKEAPKQLDLNTPEGKLIQYNGKEMKVSL